MGREKNKEVAIVAEEMKKARVKVLRGDKWQVEENLVASGRELSVERRKSACTKE